MAVTVSFSVFYIFLVSFIFPRGCFSSLGNTICNRTYTTTILTPCAPCEVNEHVDCPVATVKMTKGKGSIDCHYNVKLGTSPSKMQSKREVGCRHQCMRETMELVCCQDSVPSTANTTSLKSSQHHSCTCDVGYHYDGQYCVARDPCVEKKNLCDTRVSTCVYTEPGKYACICKMGFNMVGGRCRRMDICFFNYRECDFFARCNMLAPLHITCTCRDGYKGNGRVCRNNLADRVDDLNHFNSVLKYSLYNASFMVRKVYSVELRQQGPFTVFLPNDYAFRKLPQNLTIKEILKNKENARLFLRKHIIIGKWRMNDLVYAGKVYNLQGTEIKITSKQNKGNTTYEIVYQNSTDKANFVKYDIKAGNGIIHIINDFITNIEEARTETSKSILQVLKEDPMFHAFYTYIEIAGMIDHFSSGNITVFASHAWESLSNDIKEYIKSYEGIEKLRLILGTHILKGYVDIADLVDRKKIRSEAGHDVNSTVTEEGRVQLGSMATLHEPDIPAQNGLIHIVNGLVLPMPINEILPSKCYYQGMVQVPGPEVGFCCPKHGRELKCQKRGDLRTDKITCRFIQGGWGQQYKACRRICNRTVQIPECCRGFYGPNCLPCPGGFKFPCSGKGQCFDGSAGNGTCECDTDHTGELCNHCADSMFGPDCTIASKAKQPHNFGTCEDANPCSENAYCTTTGLDTYDCSCNDGYYGDGFVCVAIDPCETNYGGCDNNVSICDHTGPGKHQCKYMNGYEKINGEWQIKDLCRYGNVCDKNADCQMVAALNFKCTCKPSYTGDGKTCFKTFADKSVLKVLKEDETFYAFFTYIERADMLSNFSSENITVFASKNAVWDSLSDDIKEYINSDEGVETLRLILKNHILNRYVDASDLVDRKDVRSEAGHDINITVTEEGKVQIGDKATVHEPYIITQNGLIHIVDGLVLPMPINEILPSKCYYQGLVQVLGPEFGFCCPKHGRELKCQKRDDLPTDEITCRFIQGGWGEQYKICRRMCKRKTQLSKCCRGFYGPNCLPCPGGFKLPCSGNGQCFDGSAGNGTCKCGTNHTGDMCDQCADNLFGPDCTIRNRICEDANPCDENATCVTTGPDTYDCSCKDGYHGDGFVCFAIDPCQTNYGRCDNNVSICVYTGPGKHECKSLNGYEKIEGNCRYDNSVCDKNAACVMMTPFDSKCICKPSYEGDGKTCLKNLADVVGSLYWNEQDGDTTIYYSYMMIRSYFSEELRYHGPFTLFLPSDDGLRKIFKNMNKMIHFMRNQTAVRQILREHIVAGKYSTRDLRNIQVLYSLQGVKVEVKTKKKGSSYRYRLRGPRSKTNIVKSDIRASNGIIHVVDRALTNDAKIKRNENKSILELLRKDGSYNRFRTFINVAGVDTNFTSDNITVFASKNSDWDALPKDTVAFFLSKEGKKDLRDLLLHHIVDDSVDVISLIDKGQVQSMAGHEVNITVSKQGQIQLDKMANISQTDILANNGIIHQIDGILMPKTIKHFSKSRCDYRITKRVTGKCHFCKYKLKYKNLCKEGDVPTEETTGCFIIGGWGQQYQGCTRICLRTVDVIKKCCPGFFGPDCSPCPGGSSTPCSRNGQCADGIRGNGECRCDVGFTGDMCDIRQTTLTPGA